MNKAEFTTNADVVMEKFIKLTTKEMKKAIRSAIQAGQRKIVNTTKSNLRASYNGTNTQNPKYSDTLIQGVRRYKVREDKEHEMWGTVSITPNRKTGSGSYRLRFLENGTADRYVKTRKGVTLKKLAYRGSIQPKPFFDPAVQSFYNQWPQQCQMELDKAINKINQTKI